MGNASTWLGCRPGAQACKTCLGSSQQKNISEHVIDAGLITPPDFVRLTSTAAARAFNIYPRKGVLAPGSDADVIIFDPAAEHVLSAASHHSRMDTNIYEGRAVTGKARRPLLLLKQGVQSGRTSRCRCCMTARCRVGLLCVLGTVLAASPMHAARAAQAG